MGSEQNRKTAIILAAQKLFAQFGLRKTSVDEIARGAQVAKGTIYNYFASKEEIFSAVVHHEAASLIEQIRQAVDKETDCIGKLRAYLLTKISKIRERVNFYQVTRETFNEYWPYVEGVKEEHLKAEKSIVHDILTEGNAGGELVVSDPGLVAHVIVVSTSGMEATWLLSDISISLEEFVDSTVEVIVRGVARK